jgi:hypothetical protein
MAGLAGSLKTGFKAIRELCEKPFCHPEPSEGSRIFSQLGDFSVVSLPQNDRGVDFRRSLNQVY